MCLGRGAPGLAALLLLASAEVVASDWSLFTDIYSNSFSEPLPIVELIEDDFKSELHSGAELAFTHDIARFGARRGPWEASAFYRYDYYLQFHPDTAELYYRDRTDQPMETNRNYRIYLQAIHAQMYGVSLSRAFKFHPKIRLRAQINVMRADDLTDGTLDGRAVVGADDTYSGTAQVEYFYEQDDLFERPDVEPSTGWGAAVDVYLQWDVTDRIGLKMYAEDLVSRIWWEDAPFTSATVNSETTTFGDDGLIDARPVLSGIEGYEDFEQELPKRYQLQLGYRPRARWEMEFQYDHIEEFGFYRANLGYQPSANLRLNFSLDFTREALGLGFRYRAVELFVLSDDVNFEDARALEVRLAVALPL